MNLLELHPLLRELPSHEEHVQQSLSLSVLIPVCNERHLVEASVKRVLALESACISHLEVIIVDDHSTDGTWEALRGLAAEDARVRLFRHEENRGKGAAIRTALEHATGDVSIVHDAAPGGRAVILVPQHPALYGSLDTVLEHRERYTAAGMESSLRQAGFRVEKALEALMPAIRRLYRVWPWGGLSVVGIGIKD